MSVTKRWLSGSRRKRTVGILLAVGAVAAAMAVVVPAFGQDHPITLHIGGDGQYFEYGSERQPIEVGKKGKLSCQVTNPVGSLMAMSAANGSPLPVGFASLSLGVKSPGSNSAGTPCSQVSTGESLALEIGSAFPFRSFRQAQLDLEMTGDAVVELRLVSRSGVFQTYFLQTGTSITSGTALIDRGANPSFPDSVVPGTYGCTVANSSGPNSQANDNCIWDVAPTDFLFHKIVLSVVDIGTVSLEGGSDTGFDSAFWFGNAPSVGGSGDVDEDTTATFQIAQDFDSYQGLSTSCSSSEGAAIADNGDGSIDYTPAPNFNGTDNLNCTVSDDTSSVSGTFTVTVNAVNDPPVAVDDPPLGSEYSVNDGEILTVIAPGVLGNDTDVDGDELTAALATGPAEGSVTVNSHGGFTYNASSTYVWGPEEFSYQDTFTYTASDEILDDTATVTVTVYRVICTDDEVPFASPSGLVNGVVTKLSGDGEVICKRFELVAFDEGEGEDARVVFLPESDSATLVNYRAYMEFGPQSAPILGTGGGSFGPVTLEYDPAGGTAYQPVQWCIDPVFDDDLNVIEAVLPTGESWCIASAFAGGTTASPEGSPQFIIRWQVFGLDDPGFRVG